MKVWWDLIDFRAREREREMTYEFTDDAFVDEVGDGDAEDANESEVATSPTEIVLQSLSGWSPILYELVLVCLHSSCHLLSLSLPWPCLVKLWVCVFLLSLFAVRVSEHSPFLFGLVLVSFRLVGAWFLPIVPTVWLRPLGYPIISIRESLAPHQFSQLCHNFVIWRVASGRTMDLSFYFYHLQLSTWQNCSKIVKIGVMLDSLFYISFV